MLNKFVKRMFAHLIGPKSTEKRFGAEYTCKIFGHMWNMYSERSSYGKVYCNRCECEFEKR